MAFLDRINKMGMGRVRSSIHVLLERGAGRLALAVGVASRATRENVNCLASHATRFSFSFWVPAIL